MNSFRLVESRSLDPVIDRYVKILSALSNDDKHTVIIAVYKHSNILRFFFLYH